MFTSCSDTEEGDRQSSRQTPDSDEHPVVTKLNQIVIPKVDFSETPIEEAIDFARMRSIQLDPEEDPTRKGISFILRIPKQEGELEREGELGFAPIEPTRTRTITYKADDVRYLDLVAEIARQAALDAYLTSVGIMVVPEDQPPFPNAKAKEGEIWKTLRKASQNQGEQAAEVKRGGARQ